MTPAPNRRWFRYSLRTLFAVVTVFGVWLDRELNIVRQRQKAVAEIESLGGQVFTAAHMDDSEIAQFSCPRIQFWRSWLRDKAVAQLILPFEYTDEREL